MKYFEKNDNVIEGYEILFDEVELANIIKELNEKCSRKVKVTVNISAQEDRALENFKTLGKDIIEVTKKEENNAFGNVNSGKRYSYECEYFREQPSQLSCILGKILSCKNRPNEDVTDTIEDLLAYKDNDELKPYEMRMAEKGITQDLYFEYENNKDFDFELLYELYVKALGLFKKKLVSKTFDYGDKGIVKKLGGK